MLLYKSFKFNNTWSNAEPKRLKTTATTLVTVRHHSINTYAKFSSKLTFLTNLRNWAYQRVRRAYALNKWTLTLLQPCLLYFDLLLKYSIICLIFNTIWIIQLEVVFFKTQRKILSLTHFKPMFPLYTPWKHDLIYTRFKATSRRNNNTLKKAKRWFNKTRSHRHHLWKFIMKSLPIFSRRFQQFDCGSQALLWMLQRLIKILACAVRSYTLLWIFLLRGIGAKTISNRSVTWCSNEILNRNTSDSNRLEFIFQNTLQLLPSDLAAM